MSFLACLFYCDVVISDFGNPSCQPQVCGAAKAKPAKPPTEKERSLMQTSLLGLDIKPKNGGCLFFAIASLLAEVGRDHILLEEILPFDK